METELKSSSEPEESEVSDLAVEDELSQWFSPNAKPGGTESDDRYINVQKDCAADGTHLFSSMQALKQVPMHVHTQQGIEINCVQREREQDKCKAELEECVHTRDKAIRECQSYRTLAERCQKEVSDLKHEMHRRVLSVQDFWRNKLFKGQSRSCNMVRSALNINI